MKRSVVGYQRRLYSLEGAFTYSVGDVALVVHVTISSTFYQIYIYVGLRGVRNIWSTARGM
jgi:hypothetical protein